MTPADLLILGALLCLLVGAGFDLARFEIPDTLSILLLVGAVILGLLTPGFGWGSHALALLAMFAVGLLLFALGWMGGGDVKLLTAFAAWTGLKGLPLFLTGVALAGGVLALVLIGTRSALKAAGRAPETMPKLFRPDAPMPYAVAIAAGGIFWALRSGSIG
ncbi:MAG: prepilin peptidase [Sphingomonadaceae bacterium]